MAEDNKSQFVKALEILRDFPKFDPEEIETWRQQLKARLLDAGIDAEQMAEITQPGVITGIAMEHGKLVLDIDWPDENLAQTVENWTGYAFFLNWALSDEPLKPKTLLSISSKPSTIIYPKDTITRKFFHNELPYGEKRRIKQDMEDDLNGVPAYAIVTRENVSLINLPDCVNITNKDGLTPEHDQVFRIVCSYYNADKRVFTDAGICQSMGKSNTKENRDRINEIILFLMQELITIDTGTMGDYYNFERKKLRDNVLHIKILEETVGNQYGESTIREYQILAEPTFLTYGKLLNQIVRYPRAIFDTPVHKTLDTISLHFYLMERISSIGKLSNKIVYDTIYQELNLTAHDHTSKASLNNQKAAIRKKTRAILKAWTEKKYIKGWHEETKDHKKVILDKNGNATKGVSSYCVAIEGKPTLLLQPIE